jgi:hypothetical protein
VNFHHKTNYNKSHANLDIIHSFALAPSSHVPMAHSVAAARRSPDPSAQVPAQTASSATHRIDDASSSRPPHESGFIVFLYILCDSLFTF